MRGFLIFVLSVLGFSEFFLFFTQKELAASVVRQHDAVVSSGSSTIDQWRQYESSLVGLGMVHALVWCLPFVFLLVSVVLVDLHIKNKQRS